MRQIQTTPKYLQGPNLLENIGELLEPFGKKVFVFITLTLKKSYTILKVYRII